MMTKFEKRLCVFAMVFVAVYIGAVALTLHSKVSGEEKISRFESAAPDAAEGRLMLAELLLPMLIFLTVTVSFVVVKNKRAKKRQALEESEDEFT